jgi:hypothetical protein
LILISSDYFKFLLFALEAEYKEGNENNNAQEGGHKRDECPDHPVPQFTNYTLGSHNSFIFNLNISNVIIC